MLDLDQEVLGYDKKPLTYRPKIEVEEDGKKSVKLGDEQKITIRKCLEVSLLNKISGATEAEELRVNGWEFARGRYLLACKVRDAKGSIEINSDEKDILCSTLPLSHEVVIAGQIIDIIVNSI
jgi:hypothetical protein